MNVIAMSKKMEEYFASLDKEVNRSYEIANKAKKNSFDPDNFVDIPLAQNMMERVVGLISILTPQIRNKGVEQRIQDLEKQYGRLDWRVALTVSLEIAQEKFCKFKDKREAMEIGIRTGLAYVTLGVVVSPLEGFSRLELKKRKDGKEYFALFYAGPIRSAGGTAASVSVIVADYIRLKMGYNVYDATKEEISRSVSEVKDYHERVTNLQYLPSDEEVTYLASKIPVQITGDASEKFEVSNYKDLERIETNFLRNGFCLVFAECFAQKAKKVNVQLLKWGKDFFADEWFFLDEFLKIQAKNKAQEKTDVNVLLKPDFTFIKDLVAGRPVFTHPLAKGGFRLRYGRGRNTGLSGQAIHPSTMYILNQFIAIGTQLKVERPGKAAVVGSCDSIEGPIVKLKNGDVLILNDFDLAKKVSKDVEEIIYIGDILINYGDFLNRAHKLVPIGYNNEWWRLESKVDKKEVTIDEVKKYCLEKLPLHPKYLFRWTEITKEQFFIFINWLKNGVLTEDKIILNIPIILLEDGIEKSPKRVLELLGVPHRCVLNEHIVIEKEWKDALLLNINGNFEFSEKDFVKNNSEKTILEVLNEKCGYKIRDKSGTTIGCRMGRPEKAKMRKLTGSPQILFPVGNEGGRMRSLQAALISGKIKSQFAIHFCEKCNKETIYFTCEKCGNKTIQKNFCNFCKKESDKEECCGRKTVRYKNFELNIYTYFSDALKRLDMHSYTELIKGVKGTSSEDHIVEHLSKGILRAKYGLYVNKDGTIRYDMTEMPLSLDFNEKIIILENDEPKLVKIGELVDNQLQNNKQAIIYDCDNFEILKNNKDFISVISFDRGTYKLIKAPITAFIRHENKEKLLKIKTKTGREIIITKFHSLFTLDPYTGQVIPINGNDLKKGSFITIPNKLNLEIDIKKINLIEEFIKFEEVSKKIRVKGELFIKQIFNEVNISSLARSLKQKRTTVQRWKNASSIPLLFFYEILNFTRKESLLQNLENFNVNLSFNRSPNNIPAIIPVNDLFLKFLGYYISEGYSDKNSNNTHKGNSYYIYFTNSEKELLDDYIYICNKLFGLKPKQLDKENDKDCKDLRIDNAIVYYLLDKILECGSLAKNKRIPTKFIFLPKSKLKYLLRAYFSGDGYCSASTTFRTGCSTINKDLADDINLCLLKFNIIGTIKEKIPKYSELGFISKKYYDNPNINYYITFGGSNNVEIFSREIGFIQPRKNETLLFYLSKGQFIWKHDRFPIEPFLNSLSYENAPKYKLLGGSRSAGNISREKLILVNEKIQEFTGTLNSTINNLTKSDLFFDEVIDVTYVDSSSKFVYDIEVHPNKPIENFLTVKGIFAHNTHFKPKEVAASVEKIKKLGYDKDVYGNELINDDQILELKCQDIVVPCSPDTLDEKCDDVMFKITKFIDELLIKLYKVEPFYNLKNKEDLMGQLVVGMSPHTSAGIVCRIIGFSKTQGLLAHPYLHCLMRRDADGDEACIMLLMDVLLNFSKKYLPKTKGATQDEPLLLSSKLLPTEVDDMVFDMDIAFKYPLELYEAALQYKNPSEVKVSKVKDFLDTEKQYEGFGFTHDTSDINKGVMCSAYKSIPSMVEKVKGQLDIARKVRAVDESDVARLVIEKHFIRDIKGNLRKFSTQQVRCVECNEKFRRPPLQGSCLKCNGKLLFTVAEGFVSKYLDISLNIANKYNLPPYLKQNLYITKKRIEALFGKEKDKQKELIKWFN